MRRYAAAALEVIAILAAAVFGGRLAVVVLVVGGSVVLALRGGRWFASRDVDAAAGWAALVGLAVGAGALAAAWWLSPAAVEWSNDAVVRGAAGMAAMLMLVTAVHALAAEYIFRRWFLDRIASLVLSRGEPRAVALAAGVLVAALIEAVVSGGSGLAPAGAFVFSLGLGVVYVTGGGRIAGCLAARLAFELGAVLLQALRLTP